MENLKSISLSQRSLDFACIRITWGASKPSDAHVAPLSNEKRLCRGWEVQSSDFKHPQVFLCTAKFGNHWPGLPFSILQGH